MDLIGVDADADADAEPVAGAVGFVGSVKWRDDATFDVRDLTELAQHARQVRGAESAALVAVIRTPPPEWVREDLAVCAAWRSAAGLGGMTVMLLARLPRFPGDIQEPGGSQETGDIHEFRPVRP
ncbi:hypothetical protein [Streptomyces acidicola]|uniref:hypothetical protein n=1 Tax=Streptomyces acidicola TaxID=2596892 RepID=UPI003440696A